MMVVISVQEELWRRPLGLEFLWLMFGAVQTAPLSAVASQEGKNSITGRQKG